tara:strand:+ start:284 stop:436 length:153 start_codon:yes stop_codon:yes gene_type:complete
MEMYLPLGRMFVQWALVLVTPDLNVMHTYVVLVIVPGEVLKESVTSPMNV